MDRLLKLGMKSLGVVGFLCATLAFTFPAPTQYWGQCRDDPSGQSDDRICGVGCDSQQDCDCNLNGEC